MYPCSTCDRHLRDSDRLCPFCGTVQLAAVAPCFGTLALAVALIGSTACARDPGTDGSTAGTTTSTSMTSNTSMTSATESGDPADTSTSTMGDGDGDGDMTTDTNNTSGSFYAGPEVDLGGPAECDPFSQDCPEGEKCVPYSTTGGEFDANKCVQVTGSGEPGDACLYGGVIEATDDCGETSHCWGFDGEGVCMEFCQGIPDEPICPEGFQCLIDGNGVVNLCSSSCHPLLQDCSVGFACHFAGDTEEFNCGPTDDVPLGEPCGDGCAVGLTCLPASMTPDCGADGCCASYCDLSMPACEQVGTQCLSLFVGEPPAGFEDVGACVVVP
jgi:hypothetical protein